MTDPKYTYPRGKSTPRELTSTELKSLQADVWDDARAGFATIVVRGQSRKPIAGIVPADVALAYDRQEPLPDHERSRLLAAVEQARTDILAVLDRLDQELHGGAPSARGAAENLNPAGNQEQDSGGPET